jgi:acyl-CoA synthetase (AMP-forming)/AMP-acid ligase II
MDKIDLPDTGFQAGLDVPSLFRKAVTEKADETAYVFRDQRVIWRELGARVNKTANALIDLGASRGKRVAVLSRNSLNFVEAYFGAISAGACAVPLPSMASPDALRLMLEDSKPIALFIGSEFRPVVEPFIREIDSIMERGLIGLDFKDDTWQGHDLFIGPASDQPPAVEINKDDEFHIIYSSGTTGVHHGHLAYLHEHRNHLRANGKVRRQKIPGTLRKGKGHQRHARARAIRQDPQGR